MTRTRLTPNRKPRRGFTLIELLVVISIIVLLMSLIAPAIQSARRTARKLQCLNSMRNIGLAMQNFSSSNNGRLPSTYAQPTVTNSAGQSGTMNLSWAIQLLPSLDNAALLKNIKNDANNYVAGPPATLSFNAADRVAVEVFTCPDHVTAFKVPGGLSYVVNSGFAQTGWGTAAFLNSPNQINWDGTGAALASNVAVSQATGVIWPAGYVSSLEYVSSGDGTSTTILLSENLQANTWDDYSYGGSGFGVKLPTPLGSGTVYPNAGAATSPPLLIDPVQAPTAINGSKINQNASTAAKGLAPRPSSLHVGGVNVIMCDGAGKFMIEGMDPKVYIQLMTSNAVAFGEQVLDQAAF